MSISDFFGVCSTSEFLNKPYYFYLDNFVCQVTWRGKSNKNDEDPCSLPTSNEQPKQVLIYRTCCDPENSRVMCAERTLRRKETVLAQLFYTSSTSLRLKTVRNWTIDRQHGIMTSLDCSTVQTISFNDLAQYLLYWHDNANIVEGEYPSSGFASGCPDLVVPGLVCPPGYHCDDTVNPSVCVKDTHPLQCNPGSALVGNVCGRRDPSGGYGTTPPPYPPPNGWYWSGWFLSDPGQPEDTLLSYEVTPGYSVTLPVEHEYKIVHVDYQHGDCPFPASPRRGCDIYKVLVSPPPFFAEGTVENDPRLYFRYYYADGDAILQAGGGYYYTRWRCDGVDYPMTVSLADGYCEPPSHGFDVNIKIICWTLVNESLVNVLLFIRPFTKTITVRVPTNSDRAPQFHNTAPDGSSGYLMNDDSIVPISANCQTGTLVTQINIISAVRY